jgi:hypothetical protein
MSITEEFALFADEADKGSRGTSPVGLSSIRCGGEKPQPLYFVDQRQPHLQGDNRQRLLRAGVDARWTDS